MATVNPGTDGSPCESSTCISNTALAFWTWSGTSTGITTEQPPTTVSGVNTFVPGCYDISNPGDTWCVPQPDTTTNFLDSVGDRLMSPLAYRYITPCEEGRASYESCEYMAVTQTVNENSGAPPTGIRYYTLAGPVSPSTSPTLVYQGDFYDSSGSFYYWMSSNAIDKSENIGYTFSGGNGTSPNYPSLYADRLDSGNNKGTITLAKAGTGSMQDTCNKHWGEYVSTSIDPADDLTFWSVGEYLYNDIGTCHGAEWGCGMADYSDCGLTSEGWRTEAFTCQEGSGLCP